MMPALLLSLLLSSAPVLAADVDLFEPAASLAAGQGSLQGESPTLAEPGFAGGVLAGFSQDPVVRRFTHTDAFGPAVAGLAPLHVQGGYTIEDRARIDLLVPLYPWVDAPLTGFRGAALGDLRLQGTVPVWRSVDGATSFAVVPRLGLPTGSANALVSRGFSTDLIAALGGRVQDFGWVANAGLALMGNRPLDGAGPGLGSRFELLGGAWAPLTESLRAGAEVELDLGLAGGAAGTNNGGTAQVFAQQILPTGVGLTVGAGTGFIGGVGSPRYRVLAALTYAAVERDADGDGIVDDDDRCPTEAEDVDGFQDTDGCPEVDNDRDGILDVADSCPVDPEDLDGFEDRDGCPDLDNDGDSVVDAEDACPDAPGVQALAGCPDSDGDGLVDAEDRCPQAYGPLDLEGCPDRDLDRVPDFRDACPDEPKPEEEDPATSDGCPKTVYVTSSEIVITQRVEFETGRAVLQPSALPLLASVAEVLDANPRVTRVEVQGHTDNVGPDAYNKQLSQSRAESVVAHLVKEGIAAERLVAVGYGESQPMFSNRTPNGRESNRRVQFKILEQIIPKVPPPAPTQVESSDLVSPWGPLPDPEPEDDDSPWGEIIE